MTTLLETMNQENTEKTLAIPLEQIIGSDLNFYETQENDSESEIKLKSLEESIKAVGQLTPITVFKNNDGYYEILSGHTRFSAIKNLYSDNIGNGTILARVVSLENAENDDENAFEKLGYIVQGNIQRDKNFTQIETEIKYWDKVFDKKRENGEVSGRKDDWVAEHIGKSARTLRTLRKKIRVANGEEETEEERSFSRDDVFKSLKRTVKTLEKSMEICDSINEEHLHNGIQQIRSEIMSLISEYD